jgi:hypothetical protein
MGSLERLRATRKSVRSNLIMSLLALSMYYIEIFASPDRLLSKARGWGMLCLAIGCFATSMRYLLAGRRLKSEIEQETAQQTGPPPGRNTT